MKKVLLIISVFFLVLFGSLQLFVYLARPASSEELRIRLVQLPAITLTAPDRSTFALEQGKPLVLIYFNSECDHCQREVLEIRENIGLFSSSSVVLMSSQPLNEIESFSSGSGLQEYTNVRFGQIEPEVLGENFGTLTLPQIFVFSSEGKLITLFSGETKAAVIAGFLK